MSHPVVAPPASPLSSRLRDFAATAQDCADPSAVASGLAPLRAAFAEHRAATEGERGHYADAVQEAPRLQHAVHGLVAEHDCIDAALARLAVITAAHEPPAGAVRDQARAVLHDLIRHGDRDADLVYEAYATDIGGD
jgi:Hemerythrin HHE cation binding domain